MQVENWMREEFRRIIVDIRKSVNFIEFDVKNLMQSKKKVPNSTTNLDSLL